MARSFLSVATTDSAYGAANNANMPEPVPRSSTRLHGRRIIALASSKVRPGRHYEIRWRCGRPPPGQIDRQRQAAHRPDLHSRRYLAFAAWRTEEFPLDPGFRRHGRQRSRAASTGTGRPRKYRRINVLSREDSRVLRKTWGTSLAGILRISSRPMALLMATSV